METVVTSPATPVLRGHLIDWDGGQRQESQPLSMLRLRGGRARQFNVNLQARHLLAALHANLDIIFPDCDVFANRCQDVALQERKVIIFLAAASALMR